MTEENCGRGKVLKTGFDTGLETSFGAGFEFYYLKNTVQYSSFQPQDPVDCTLTMLVKIQNVTQQKKMEAELMEHRGNLERLKPYKTLQNPTKP